MSLKNYIAQVEAKQLNELAGTPPSTTSTATAPQQGQKVIVKPGQPLQQQQQQPQATITNQAGKVIAQADAENAKKFGDLVNTGGITMMDPQTGKPLEEDGLEEVAPAVMETSSMLDEALERIKETHPYEHKQFLEGWGMDNSLFEALAEHYFKEGKVPRAVWHGHLEELKQFIEDCYAKDNGIGGNQAAINNGAVVDETHTGRLTDRDLNPDEYKTKPTMGQRIAQGARNLGNKVLDTLGHGSDEKMRQDLADKVGVRTPPNRYNEGTLEEVSALEKRLKQPTEETAMFESKGKSEKTEKGLKHTGTYGKEYETDAEGNEKKIEKDEPKKGRGRPKKDGGETGKGFDSSSLMKVMGGKKPKKEVGKVSAKNKLTDKSRDEKADAEFEKSEKSDKKKVDETISKWDAQLRTLLESKEIVKEGLTVSTSVGQEGAPDSVSITANDEDAHQLLALLNNAGMGSGVPGHAVKRNPSEELLKAHGTSQDGGSFSIAGTEEPGDVEVTDFDGAQDEISGNVDDGMDAMRKMLAAMGIGKDAAPEPKHPEGFDGSHSEEEPEDDSEEDSEEKEKIVGEEDVEEGNKFTGNLAKAREEGDTEADLDGDGDMEKVEPASDSEEDSEDEDEEDKEKVEEGQQTCNECGSMYEGEGHECSHEKMEEEQLNEWANSPQGQSEDEDFTATIEYFTKAISGGLNGQKRDQTVMPHTSVKVSEGYNIDVAAEMRKLAGIR